MWSKDESVCSNNKSCCLRLTCKILNFFQTRRFGSFSSKPEGQHTDFFALETDCRQPDNKNEPPHDKTNKLTCAPSEDSDQPGHPPSLIRVFAVRM